MNLQELITITNELFYNSSPSYKVIESKQRELLSIISPYTNINKIDNNTINKYISILKSKNNKTTTINAKLAYLSKLLNYAYRNSLIKFKPYIPTFKIQATKEKYLTQDEIDLMLKYCEDNNLIELMQVIIIGLNTGLRINNILTVTLDDIDNNYLRVWESKNNNPQSIPLNKTMQDLIKDFKPFTLKYRQIYYQFELMKYKLNLDDDNNITIHTLRHTFCSNLIQKGVPITTIQKLANHKKLTTTMRYAHLSNKELEEAVNCL